VPAGGGEPVKIFFIILTALSFAPGAIAAVSVTDDTGQVLRFAQPPQRVIALSPHITELLYAAGAGDRIVAAVEFSNYPPQAKQLPRVGRYDRFDLERIVALKPDLVIAWQTGNPAAQVQRIRDLGIPVYFNEPRQLADVADTLKKFGRLLGTEATAHQAATSFMKKIAVLQKKYQHAEPVRVFYQVWNQPLYTVNGQHLISHVIKLCGGVNVFDKLSLLAPQVDIEAVIQQQPDVIVIGAGPGRENWKQAWQLWPVLNAVKQGQVCTVNADLIVRHTPRILAGAQQVCACLDGWRHRQH